jgi:hypothetical protein
MSNIAERSDELTGTTRKIVIETMDHSYPVFITINEQNGRPFEVFIRTDHPQLYEWITALTLLVTRLLRQGDALDAIAAELQSVHSSATTMHFLPSGEQCISMVARIGRVLSDHARSTHE